MFTNDLFAVPLFAYSSVSGSSVLSVSTSPLPRHTNSNRQPISLKRLRLRVVSNIRIICKEQFQENQQMITKPDMARSIICRG